MKLNKRDRNTLERRGFSYFFSSSLLPFKLTKIDKYLFLEFIKSCFGAVLFFTFIYEMTQLFMQMDVYLSRPSEFNTIERILIIHISKLPYNIILFSPLGFLFGTMFTLSNFYKNSEVVTVIGSGVHLFRFTLPILAFSFIYSVFLIFFGEYIMAPLYNTSENILWEIEHKQPIVDYSEGVKNLKTSGEGGLNYNNIGYFDPENQLMKNGIVITRNKKDLSGNEISLTQSNDFDNDVPIIDIDKSIKENIENINKVLNSISENNTNDENTSSDRIVSITETETQDIDIDDLFNNDVNTKIDENNIFEKDNIPPDTKPNVSSNVFNTKSEDLNVNTLVNTDENNNHENNNLDEKDENSVSKTDDKNMNINNNNKTPNTEKVVEIDTDEDKDLDKNERIDTTHNDRKEKDEPIKENFTVITQNDNEPDLSSEMSITKRRNEYYKRTDTLSKMFNYDDYDDYEDFSVDNPNNNQSNGLIGYNTKQDVEDIQNEVAGDIVNVILGLDYELNGYGTTPINETDINSNSNSRTELYNTENNDKKSENDNDISRRNEKSYNQNDIEKTTNEKNNDKEKQETNDKKSIEDLNNKINNTSINKVNDDSEQSQENIEVNDLESVNLNKPDIDKIREVTKQTYINQQENDDNEVSSTSIGVPIEGPETDNQPVEFEFDDENDSENEIETPEIDENPVYYYRNLLNIENPFKPNIDTDNKYDGRTIDLRLDAECLVYLDDGWYSKCYDNEGNLIDAEATLWEWDDNGNLLLGYPEDLTGEKIDLIMDKPFHFEDNTNTQMDTISFSKGLRVINKLRKSGKVYKNKQSELFGRKLYFPFASFIITLVGIGLGRFHTKKGVLISTFFFALMFFAIYYVFYQVGESVGSLSAVPIPGYIAPLFGNLVFLGIGAIVLKNSKT